MSTFFSMTVRSQIYLLRVMQWSLKSWKTKIWYFWGPFKLTSTTQALKVTLKQICRWSFVWNLFPTSIMRSIIKARTKCKAFWSQFGFSTNYIRALTSKFKQSPFLELLGKDSAHLDTGMLKPPTTVESCSLRTCTSYHNVFCLLLVSVQGA